MTQRIVGSYTFFNELENCPHKAYHVRVGRTIQRTESEAARWGNYVHEAMEHRIGEGKPLPEDLGSCEPFARAFDGRSVKTELKVGVTKEGYPTRFFGPDCYVAGKIDVVVTHRLDQVGKEYVQRSVPDRKGLVGSGQGEIPPAQVSAANAARWAGEQADVILALAPVLEAKLELEGQRAHYERVELPLAFVLVLNW